MSDARHDVTRPFDGRHWSRFKGRLTLEEGSSNNFAITFQEAYIFFRRRGGRRYPARCSRKRRDSREINHEVNQSWQVSQRRCRTEAGPSATRLLAVPELPSIMFPLARHRTEERVNVCDRSFCLLTRSFHPTSPRVFFLPFQFSWPLNLSSSSQAPSLSSTLLLDGTRPQAPADRWFPKR